MSRRGSPSAPPRAGLRAKAGDPKPWSRRSSRCLRRPARSGRTSSPHQPTARRAEQEPDKAASEQTPAAPLLGSSLRLELIERAVQGQHVDVGLADDPERPPLHVGVDQRTHLILGKVAGLRDARHLEQGGGRRDVRIGALPEVVTRSTGTGIAGFSALRAATSALRRSASALLVGPRLGAGRVRRVVGRRTVLVASFGSVPVVADGRPWK